MKLIVTGAGGFIGGHLLSRLSSRNEIVALVNKTNPSALPDRVSKVVLDLAQPIDTKALPATVDAIVHLAQANALFPQSANELLAVNTVATQRLLDYGREAGARQFILASTGDVYGRRQGPSTEADTAQPATYYAATKYAAELLTRAYAPYLNPCIIRLYQPYGPGQSDRLIPRLAERIRQRKAVALHRECRPRLSPVFVSDVSDVLERALESCYSGTLNIAGNDIVNMRELAEKIGQALKIEPIYEATGEKAGDLAGDNKLMRQVFGNWQMVALDDGLARTFAG